MIEEILSIFPGLFQLLSPQESIYLVGGAIRDRLLNRKVHDLDFVTGFDARQLARKVANHCNGAFFILDEDRAIYRVVSSEKEQKRTFLDFARFQGNNLEEDLYKRDFSMNAVAVAVNDPTKVFDPCMGVMDIQNKIIRVCSDNSFKDDPLRILRAVRFATSYGFHIESQTIALLRQAVHRLPRVANERIRDEIFFLLEGQKTRTAFYLMEKLGILDVITPELIRLKSIPQSLPHIYHVWDHTLAVVNELENIFSVLVGTMVENHAEIMKFATASLHLGRYRNQLKEHFCQEIVPGRSRRSLLFLAALFHDCGKNGTLTHDETGKLRFFDHERLSADMIAERCNILALSQAEINWEKTLLLHHMRIHHLVQTGLPLSRRSIFRYFRDCGPAGVDICLLTLADFIATSGNEYPEHLWTKYLETCKTLLDAWWDKKTEVVQPVRLLNGNEIKEIFALDSGPLIGKLLSELQEAQAAGEINLKEQAIKFIEDRLNNQTGMM